jgi:transcriptional regulator with XRE-family HTH domain
VTFYNLTNINNCNDLALAEQSQGVDTVVVFHAGDVIRKLREQQGIKLVDLAARAGISPTTLTALEHTGARYRPETLQKVAQVLGVTVEGVEALAEFAQHHFRKALLDELRTEPPGGGAAAGQPATEGVYEQPVNAEGAAMSDSDLGRSLLSTLGLVPAERQDEFVAHCFQFAMHMRRGRNGARATGTDPKA